MYKVLFHFAEAAGYMHLDQGRLDTSEALIYKGNHGLSVLKVCSADQVAAKLVLRVLPEVLDRVQLTGVGAVEKHLLIISESSVPNELCEVNTQIISEDAAWSLIRHHRQPVEEFLKVLLLDTVMLGELMNYVAFHINRGNDGNSVEFHHIRSNRGTLSGRRPYAVEAVIGCVHRLIDEIQRALFVFKPQHLGQDLHQHPASLFKLFLAQLRVNLDLS